MAEVSACPFLRAKIDDVMIANTMMFSWYLQPELYLNFNEV